MTALVLRHNTSWKGMTSCMEKTALVLAGGGFRGSYQIGVWQALNELDVEINIVTGTSVGSLNAALVTMGDIESATNMWKNLKTSMILSVEVDENLPREKKVKSVIKQFFGDYVRKGGTDSYPLKQLIDSVVDEKVIRNSSISCGMVVVDKSTLKPLELYVDEIEDGLIGDYLLASSSLFPAMKSWKIGEGDYMDGGYYDNMPVELALKRGATKIIAVDLEAIGMKRNHIIKKVTDIILIKSYWDLGPLLVFDKDTVFKNIRLGYLDTMKSFNVFSGVAYTFVKNDISQFARKNREILKFYNKILNLTYGINVKTPRDNIFSLTLENHIKAKFSRSINKKYSVFLTACMETAGEIFSLDPTKIYTFESFSRKILQCVNLIEVPNLKPLESVDIKGTLSMLDKKVRTVYLAYNIRNAVQANVKIDTLYQAMFLPDEFLAAYYLAMLD